MIRVPTRAAEDPLEGLPELWTEHGVNDWIQRRVEVAEPEEKGNHRLTYYTIGAKRHHQGHNEEWQPADDERSRDNGERFCCLSLPLCFERLLPARHLCVWIIRAVLGAQGQGGGLLLRFLCAR